MQQGKIDYKKDGMSNINEKYTLLEIENIFGKHKLINVKTNG
jgi:hypothetical protein